jgi:anthranilate phosphoribosyltransferase
VSDGKAIRDGIAHLARAQDLSAQLTTDVVTEIMAGACAPAQVGAFLMGLAQKGETRDEIRGAAEAMRAAAVEVPVLRSPVIDTCGTGGSGVARRNVSTAAAIAIAACGVAVAKHGNRAASSRSGSADVLEALGVNLGADPARVGRCVDEVGVGFLFARELHPAMKHAGPIRRALGIRTIFNLLGPMCNPAAVRRQVVGVFDPGRLDEMASALGAMGSERVFVVHGFRKGVEARADAPAGIDDLSGEGESLIVEWHRGERSTHVVSPADAGLREHRWADLRGGDPAENADAMRALFAGGHADDPRVLAYRASVQFAGALGLAVAGDEPLRVGLTEHARAIGAALDDGRAAAVLARLVAYSRGESEP